MHLNLPTLLDVAIGLVFIFFIFSLFVSGIVELINSIFGQRARLLRIAFDKLLNTELSAAFFAHKLTDVKRQKFWGSTKPINYLSADSFSTVLIDLMVKAAQKTDPTLATPTSTTQTLTAIRQGLQHASLRDVKELIEPILAKSDNFKVFKAELHNWYNGYMEQVSGWYKRFAQGMIWVVSVVVTLAFNVDTIHLTNRLFNDSGLREQLVTQAVKATQKGNSPILTDAAFMSYLRDTHSPVIDTAGHVNGVLSASDTLVVQSAYVQFAQSRIEDLQLPVSWKQIRGGLDLQPGQTGVSAFLGWILTAAALSFGAPFWFELLLKLVNIRNTARRPPGNK